MGSSRINHIGHIPINGCWLGFTPTKQKVKGNDTKDTCLLNWYPMANHGNYMSQSNICHFYNSYLCKPFSIVCTILKTKPLMSWWSWEVILWSIKVCSHNFIKFSLEFCVLIYEHFCWSIKSIWNLNQKCISNIFIIFFVEWNQLNPLGKMFNHNQYISVMTNN